MASAVEMSEIRPRPAADDDAEYAPGSASAAAPALASAADPEAPHWLFAAYARVVCRAPVRWLVAWSIVVGTFIALGCAIAPSPDFSDPGKKYTNVNYQPVALDPPKNPYSLPAVMVVNHSGNVVHTNSLTRDAFFSFLRRQLQPSQRSLTTATIVTSTDG